LPTVDLPEATGPSMAIVEGRGMEE